jgi:hypothetical protein
VTVSFDTVLHGGHPPFVQWSARVKTKRCVCRSVMMKLGNTCFIMNDHE